MHLSCIGVRRGQKRHENFSSHMLLAHITTYLMIYKIGDKIFKKCTPEMHIGGAIHQTVVLSPPYSIHILAMAETGILYAVLINCIKDELVKLTELIKNPKEPCAWAYANDAGS